MNCTTSPCIISGLDPGTEYQLTVIPNNICGSPTGCPGNTATVTTLGKQCMYMSGDDNGPNICADLLYIMCNDQKYRVFRSQSVIILALDIHPSCLC